jgi:ATP-dependent Clp protease ATP-binding subunit ClpC
MFERFTDRARRVVVLAQEEARDLGHNYIGTEHILLGLLREREGVAARALESLGISLDVARQQVGEIIGTGGGMPTGHIPFTPRAKKVLELSLREALQLGHNYIGTEHILLGLVREGDGVGAQVLVGLGADLPTVRREVVNLLHEEPEPPGAGGETPVAQTLRPGRPPRPGMPGRVAGPAFQPGPPIQAEGIAARIGEVVSRLDVIAERLAVIERLLVEGKRPAAPRKPPAAKKPKPPPAKPPASGAEPPASGAEPPASGAEPPASGGAQG